MGEGEGIAKTLRLDSDRFRMAGIKMKLEMSWGARRLVSFVPYFGFSVCCGCLPSQSFHMSLSSLISFMKKNYTSLG